MAEYNTAAIISSLQSELATILHTFKELEAHDNATLNKQPVADKWSVAQVLEHLNSYNRYYLAHIEQAISNAHGNNTKPANTFRSGWLGEYFVKSMYSDVVSQGKVTNKMKAPKDHRPVSSLNIAAVISEFAVGEQKLQELLAASGKVNITTVKVPISISRFVKINVGDTFRFLIAHQVRHFLQVRNTLAAVKV